MYVSFNNYSCVKDWENDDPIGALCRRIAFAVCVDPTGKSEEDLEVLYKDKFAHLEISMKVILEWLGNTPSILLIDELNVLKTAAGHEGFAQFIKENFLKSSNRMLVFSSHVVGVGEKMTACMDPGTDRGVTICELPLISSVQSINDVLDIQINPRKALYCGSIPSMIYLYSQTMLPSNKRNEAIGSCLNDAENPINDTMILRMLEGFITGEINSVPKILLQFMNSVESIDDRFGTISKMRWIPYHMLPILEKFIRDSRTKISPNLKLMLNNTLMKYFDSFFFYPKEYSGDAWESLFMIVLLIRCSTGMFDKTLMPYFEHYDTQPTLSLNKLFNEGFSLGECKTVPDLLKGIRQPDHFPHIAIYHPEYSQFKAVDVIVIVYKSATYRREYYYQLKESDNIPATPENMNTYSPFYVVRGKAAQKDTYQLRGWTVVSESDIEAFFGESGKHWTPNEWRKLIAGTKT